MFQAGINQLYCKDVAQLERQKDAFIQTQTEGAGT